MRLEGQNTRVTSRSLARLPRRRRFHGDDGAILAEAALITPLFIFILFGILEFGGSFRDYLTLNNGVATAARKSSIAANAPDADFQILTTARREIGAMPLSQVQQVVVFHATGPTSTVPAGCLAGTTSVGTGSPDYTDACNVYTGAQFRSFLAADFGCGGGDLDVGWCPTNRKFAAQGQFGPPDFIGVYIKIKHKFYTGLFGSDQTMTKTSIIRIEPQTLGAA